MPLATKNNALVLKNGRLAENCGCCEALPCNCEAPKLQTLTITLSQPRNSSNQTSADVLAKIVEVFGGQVFTLSFFRSQIASFEHTNDVAKLYALSASDGNFSGQQSELNAMAVGDILWRSLATCPGSGASGMAITDVWSRVNVSGIPYIIKWGSRNLFFNSCLGGTLTATFLGSSFELAGGGAGGKLFAMEATMVLA
jgi:hypothetical protein